MISCYWLSLIEYWSARLANKVPSSEVGRHTIQSFKWGQGRVPCTQTIIIALFTCDEATQTQEPRGPWRRWTRRLGLTTGCRGTSTSGGWLSGNLAERQGAVHSTIVVLSIMVKFDVLWLVSSMFRLSMLSAATASTIKTIRKSNENHVMNKVNVRK